MASSSIPTLVTTSYLQPGVYIGQLIIPSSGGNLTADARACDYIGQGSRLAVGTNLAIRRSFVLDQPLTFPLSAPYIATLPYPSNGDQTSPISLFDSITGAQLRQDQWSFQKIGNQYLQVLISPSAFDVTAVYQISYQTTSRSILDPMPLPALRTIKAVGLTQDRAQFNNYVDFFIPFSYAGPTALTTNSNTGTFFTAVLADGGNTGGSSVQIDQSAFYTLNYNRFYELECTAASGSPGTFLASFQWKAVVYSAGANNEPPTPLNAADAMPTFSVDQTSPISLIPQLEFGVVPGIVFGASNFSVGDKFYFNACGPGLIEFDSRLRNTNQYVNFSPIEPTLQVGSTGGLSYAASNQYLGTYNARFRLKVIATAGSIGSRTATFVWAQYGDTLGANAIALASESVNGGQFSLTDGVQLVANFGSSTFVPGDVFDLSVQAPMQFYQAQDDRVYDLQIGSATNPGADSGTILGSYSTGTKEGGFGSFTASTNLLVGSGEQSGHFFLPNNVGFFVRNLMQGNVNGNSYATGDTFDASVTSRNVIDWSLTARAEEIWDTTSFFTDVTGSITGVAGSIYVILGNIYTAGTVSAKLESNNAPVTTLEVSGTRFLSFGATAPASAVIVDYQYIGQEPEPGQLYYFSGNFLRPLDLYNTPQLVLDQSEGRTLLGPSEVTNHLYIMNELVFANGAGGAYYTQSFDADGDGIINVTDVKTSLAAHATLTQCSDLCLVAQFSSLSDALQANLEANDPFQRREQMLWVGAPIGTPVGDVNTQESLVYLATTTLQTTPTSPALGTRVLVAPTTATMSLVLDNNVTQTVTLDGSFVAGATSALVNSFTDPGSTILRRALSGFTSMQTYSTPQNLILGGASITWLSNRGSNVFRFEEDITVHSRAGDEFQLISATTQKQYVTRVVRAQMDAQLISVVTPSPQAAIGLVRANLAGILSGLLSRGLLASYQDGSGNVRVFDPNADILIFQVPGSTTKYSFVYGYFIRSTIKQLLGLYAVNVADLAASLSA